MPEMRQNPVNGQWVVIAAERAMRPQDFPATREEPRVSDCPFCGGGKKRLLPKYGPTAKQGPIETPRAGG